jgi:cyclase
MRGSLSPAIEALGCPSATSIGETLMTRIAFAAAAALMLAGAAHAQQPATQAPAPPFVQWDKIEIKTTDLGQNTYMLEGQGGNITVAVGTDGIIMVDGQFAPLSDKIQNAIKAISPLPVKFLVNTHFHGDHTGGNENFAKSGVVIVAHDNIRVRLAAGTTGGLTGVRAPPRPAEALPQQTYFGGSLTIEVSGRKAQLTHVANAHTDGDTWVYFADANVLATGDTMNNLKRYQNIDFANGGDIRGMIRATETYLRLADDKTKVVVGHGPLASKPDIAEFRDMLVTSRDRIEKLFNEGKTEEEVIALKPLADLDANGPLASRNWRSATRGTSKLVQAPLGWWRNVIGTGLVGRLRVRLALRLWLICAFMASGEMRALSATVT